MPPNASDIAKSIVAVESMDKDGTLETALEVLRLRKSSQGPATGANKGPADEPDITEQPKQTLTFPKFDGKFSVTYGPENTKMPLPAGVSSLEQWGSKMCLLNKVESREKTYFEVANDPESCEYVKWVFDHHGFDERWTANLRDFSCYLIRLNMRYAKPLRLKRALEGSHICPGSL